MPTTVGSHSVAAFVNPNNGDALDADVVKGNDNTLRASYVAHDADAGVHLQSSVLASRPAAGVTGRKWLTTDDGPKVWYDTGSVWTEIGYVPATGTAALTNVTISGSLAVDTTTLVVDNANNRVGIGTATPGVALDVVGATRTSSGLTVTSGGVTVTGNSTITGTLGGLTGLTVASGGIAVTGNSTIAGTLGSLTGVTVTGTVTATTFSGSGASLTALNASNLGSGTVPDARFPATLPAVSGANLTNLNASNISSGTINAARLPTIAFAGAAGTASQVAVGNNNLFVQSDALVFLNLDATPTTFVLSTGASSLPADWIGPSGAISYQSNNDKFLVIDIQGTTYYIRCERWT